MNFNSFIEGYDDNGEYYTFPIEVRCDVKTGYPENATSPADPVEIGDIFVYLQDDEQPYVPDRENMARLAAECSIKYYESNKDLL